MTHHAPAAGRPELERIGYFLLQVRSTGTEGSLVGVVMEDLDSGIKHRFDTVAAVGDFLDRWARIPAAVPVR